MLEVCFSIRILGVTKEKHYFKVFRFLNQTKISKITWYNKNPNAKKQIPNTIIGPIINSIPKSIV